MQEEIAWKTRQADQDRFLQNNRHRIRLSIFASLSISILVAAADGTAAWSENSQAGKSQSENSEEVASFKRAEQLLQAGNIKDAGKLFEQLSTEHPLNSIYSINAANCCIHEKDWDKALLFAKAASNADQNSLSNALILGSVLMRLEKFSDALKIYEHALSLDRGSQSALEGMAHANLTLRNYAPAAKELDELLLKDNKIWGRYVLRTRCYWETGYVKEAIQEVDKGLLMCQQKTELYELRGRIYVSDRQFKKALSDFLSAESRKFEPRELLNKEIGETYMQLGQFQDAIPRLNKALELNPNFQGALISRASCYFQIGKLADSKADCKRALRIAPDDPFTNYSLSECYRREGREQDALGLLNRALKAPPKQPAGYILYKGRADIEFGLKQYAPASEDYKLYLEHYRAPEGEKQESKLAMIQAYLLSKNFSAALPVLIREITLAPSNLTLRAWHAQCLIGLKQTDAGLTEIKKLNKENPQNSFLWRERYQIAKQMANTTDMREALGTMLKISPGDKWAIAISKQGKNAGGIVNSDINAANDFMNKGNSKLKNLEAEQAISDYSKAIAIEPWLLEAYVQRGRAKRSLGLQAEAAADFVKALSISEFDTATLLELARTQHELKQREQAVLTYSKLIKLGKKRETTYLERGQLFLELHKLDKALSDAQNALLQNRSVREFSLKGQVLMEMHRPAEAISEFSQAIKLAPQESSLYELRSRAYEQTGDKKLASKDLETKRRVDRDSYVTEPGHGVK